MTCVLILFQSDLGHGSHWLCITSNTTDPTVTGRRASIQSTRSRLRAGRWPDRRGQCAADNAGRAWAVANRHRDHWLGRHMAGSEWRAQPRRARGPSALTWLQRNLRAPLERHRAGSVFKKLRNHVDANNAPPSRAARAVCLGRRTCLCGLGMLRPPSNARSFSSLDERGSVCCQGIRIEVFGIAPTCLLPVQHTFKVAIFTKLHRMIS